MATEALKNLNTMQGKDEPIYLKQMQVWKAIRRSMKSIFDERFDQMRTLNIGFAWCSPHALTSSIHELYRRWLPKEYETPEEVTADVLGIGGKLMHLDEAMTYALAEMDKVNQGHHLCAQAQALWILPHIFSFMNSCIIPVDIIFSPHLI